MASYIPISVTTTVWLKSCWFYQVHTADGISMRFPRVTRIRHDKDWSSATNLAELKLLVENSKQKASDSVKEFFGGSSSPRKRSSTDTAVDDVSPVSHKLFIALYHVCPPIFFQFFYWGRILLTTHSCNKRGLRGF